jgi:hypothetical protein
MYTATVAALAALPLASAFVAPTGFTGIALPRYKIQIPHQTQIMFECSPQRLLHSLERAHSSIASLVQSSILSHSELIISFFRAVWIMFVLALQRQDHLKHEHERQGRQQPGGDERRNSPTPILVSTCEYFVPTCWLIKI